MGQTRATRWNLLFIAFAATLPTSSCTNSNRMVTVECGAPPGVNLGVKQADSFDGPPTWGLMTSHPLSIASLLELRPPLGGEQVGRLVSIYSIEVSTRESLPLRSDSAFWALVDVPFSLNFSSGDSIQARSSNAVSLVYRIVQNTTAVVSDAQRMTLRDPLAVLNADKHARQIVRSADAQSIFVMVTGLLYGSRIDLVGLNYSEHPEIAVNTVSLGNVYLHYKFACSSMETINAKGKSGKPVPVAFLYRSVRYSDTGNIIWSDAISANLARYKGI